MPISRPRQTFAEIRNFQFGGSTSKSIKVRDLIWLSSGFHDSRMGKIQPKIPKMRIYDLPGGGHYDPPLDASIGFTPLDLQGYKLSSELQIISI